MGAVPDFGGYCVRLGLVKRVLVLRRVEVGQFVQTEPNVVIGEVELNIDRAYGAQLHFRDGLVGELLELFPALAAAVRVILRLPLKGARPLAVPSVLADIEARLGTFDSRNADGDRTPLMVEAVRVASSKHSIEVRR